MTSLTRITATVAALGGLCWTVKAVIITARDGSFDPLESYVFVAGLLGLLAAVLLTGALAGSGRRGLARAVVSATAALGAIAATAVLTGPGQALVAALAPGDNLGLEEEGGILLAGVAWLFVAARISSARPQQTVAIA